MSSERDGSTAANQASSSVSTAAYTGHRKRLLVSLRLGVLKPTTSEVNKVTI